MSSLLETLSKQLGGDSMQQIGRLLGTDEKKAGQATGAALTTLLGALSRNASNEGGARALHTAIAKDHDGSALDRSDTLLENPGAGPGEGILRHVLGGKREAVENGLSRAAGVDRQSMGKLLTALAPMVLAGLGQAQRKNNMNANELAGMLGRERQQLERAEPAAGGIMSRLLDTDGDGDLDVSDLARHGKGMLGKLFGRGRP